MLLVVLTGYQGDPARFKEAGFDHHVIKPPDLQKLSNLLTTGDLGIVFFTLGGASC